MHSFLPNGLASVPRLGPACVCQVQSGADWVPSYVVEVVDMCIPYHGAGTLIRRKTSADCHPRNLHCFNVVADRRPVTFLAQRDFNGFLHPGASRASLGWRTPATVYLLFLYHTILYSMVSR